MFGKKKPAHETFPPPSAGAFGAPPVAPALEARPERQAVFKPGSIYLSGGRKLDVIVKDMTASGARIEFFIHEVLPPTIATAIPGRGKSRARVVWQQDGSAGLAFEPDERAYPPAKAAGSGQR